jgi:large subunit ribosomal protein L18
MIGINRKELTRRRHKRVRRKVSGTADRPRLAVFRSHQHIYVQAIDDTGQRTLAAASTVEPDLRSKLDSGSTQAAATEVGKLIAERVLSLGIRQVVFDRGGNLYHGRVQALAEAAREAGLEF